MLLARYYPACEYIYYIYITLCVIYSISYNITYNIICNITKLAEVIAKVKSLKPRVASLQNAETRNSQLAKDVFENKEIISDLKKKDVFQTKIVNELKSKLNQSMNKFEKLETTVVFNMASLLNVLDNKSKIE